MRILVSTVLVSLAFVCSGFAQTRPTLFIDASNGFDISIAAAITKKHVPVDVMSDRAKAAFVLRSTDVIQKVNGDTTGTKVAKMIFGVPTILPATVSVKLLDANGKVLWAYNCMKAGGIPERNLQSLAEAIAKHLKNHLDGKE